MLETKVPKDIRVYKTKLVGGLTFRQFICVVLMILLDLFLYNVILKQAGISIENIIFLLIFMDVPIAAFGWMEPMGMKMEVYLRKVVLYSLLAPTRRKAVHKIVETKHTVAETTREKRQRKKNERKNPELKGFK